MQIRLRDRKVIKAVKADAKARKSSCARTVEMALATHYSGGPLLNMLKLIPEGSKAPESWFVKPRRRVIKV